MIPLRSLPMLLSSLGVLAFVGWITVYNVRHESLFVDTASRPAAVTTAMAASQPRHPPVPLARS